MTTIPDGIEVVATRTDAEGLARDPLLIVDAVTAFLDSRGLGAGPLSWSRIGNGQSNVTYRICRGNDAFVLRRGPRPPLPRSAHDMVREARIQQLVTAQGIPVPEIVAICEDELVLGVPFYVMSFVDGEVITDTIPQHLSQFDERKATSLAVIDTLVKLHSVDVHTGDLAAFGRPDGYLRRQVDRFGSLWDVNTTRWLPDVARVGDWLGKNIPESKRAAVVHGDFRTGNLMFAKTGPARVTALLDWEMATIGDPLADLGYLTATYAEPGSIPTPLELTSVTREPGYLRRGELVARYQELTGADVQALPWYQTLAMWKAAIFCEAIYTRWLTGERPDDLDFGPTLADGVPRLLENAMHFAGIGATKVA